MTELILVLDFGGQYKELIARPQWNGNKNLKGGKE